jgi:DNA-directed RNA polymerase specialized sigma24 family protein
MLRALSLSSSCRDVFLLKEIRGHSLEEIAAILKISTEKVALRLKRAQQDIGHLESDKLEDEK